MSTLLSINNNGLYSISESQLNTNVQEFDQLSLEPSIWVANNNGIKNNCIICQGPNQIILVHWKSGTNNNIGISNDIGVTWNLTTILIDYIILTIKSNADYFIAIAFDDKNMSFISGMSKDGKSWTWSTIITSSKMLNIKLTYQDILTTDNKNSWILCLNKSIYSTSFTNPSKWSLKISNDEMTFTSVIWVKTRFILSIVLDDGTASLRETSDFSKLTIPNQVPDKLSSSNSLYYHNKTDTILTTDFSTYVGQSIDSKPFWIMVGFLPTGPGPRPPDQPPYLNPYNDYNIVCSDKYCIISTPTIFAFSDLTNKEVVWDQLNSQQYFANIAPVSLEQPALPKQCVCVSTTCYPTAGTRPTISSKQYVFRPYLMSLCILYSIILAVLSYFIYKTYNITNINLFISISVSIGILPMIIFSIISLIKQTKNTFGPICHVN